MEQRISLVTLGVAELARARAFYEALGWRGAKQSSPAARSESSGSVFRDADCRRGRLGHRVGRTGSVVVRFR
jgi:catechol 2,3-dioxygenase-like lactoylglutathione lyase family enzyme